jgi:N-acetylglutamate synthase-like GNAT family acetyltransferase
MAAPAFATEDMDRRDAPALQAMLAGAELPPAVIDGEVRFFTLRAPDGPIAGFAGLELCGGDALLRSVVVTSAYRGRGGGRAVVAAALDRAAALGISTV